LSNTPATGRLEEGLSFLGLFRRPAKIQDPVALADFIDAHAAFIAQKGIYEYSRARAGHYAKVLFQEQEFLTAADNARWRAFPLALGMVAEVAEGVLRPHAQDRLTQLAALSELVLSVLDRYPVPETVGAQDWSVARAELARRLQLIGLHAPKLVKDIPGALAKAYFDLMPIHHKLKWTDYPTTENYLKITLINAHTELTKRLDAPAVATQLRAGGR
jgi:hypothetical protein